MQSKVKIRNDERSNCHIERSEISSSICIANKHGVEDALLRSAWRLIKSINNPINPVIVLYLAQ